MDTLSAVRSFLQDRLGIDPARVTPDADLGELGVDSLMLLELIFDFEDQLDADLPKDIATPRTIGQLLAIVEQMQAAQATP